MLNLSYDYLRPSTTTGKMGQLTKITNNLDASSNKNRTYDYDGIGRLKSAKGGATGTLWTQTYSHDRLGNRTNVVATGNAAGTGGAMPTDGLPTTANYEQASNRLTSIVPNASTGINPANPNFEYDATGNQTRVIQSNGVAQRYCYDAAGRLSQVKADDNTTMVASYGYGASNQRLKQTEYVSGVGTTICYAWSGSSIIGEYLDNGSLVWQKCYVHLGGRLLSTQVPGTATNAMQYHHPDRLGTRVISNAGDTGYSENAVLPYGTAIDAESAGTTTNRRFTSYDRSSVTKLDYAVNRFYDCKQGRFTQVDPIGMSAASLSDPQTLNLYSYCSNDPVNATDLDGLFWKQLFGAIKKFFSNIYVKIAVVVALTVISLGILGPLTVTSTVGSISLGGGATIGIAGATQLTALGWAAAGLAAVSGVSLPSGGGNYGGFLTPGINGSVSNGVSSFLQQASQQQQLISDGNLIKDAVLGALSVLSKIKGCQNFLKGSGSASQGDPGKLLKGLYDSKKGVVADRSVTGERAHTSYGDGLGGYPITLGKRWLDENTTGVLHSYNSGTAYAYAIKLTPRQQRISTLLHELGHKTGRFATDFNSKEQDYVNKSVTDNCIRPAIKRGII